MSAFGPGLVTVFGGSGFVGNQVVAALARRGWRVRVAVRRPHLAFELRPMGDPGQIQLLRCDATRREDVAAALDGADAVVNLIGVLFETPRRKFETMHVEAARNIAEAATAAGVKRLVHISAIGAGGASDYARTKGEGEQAVRAARPDAVIVRPSIVFGKGDGFFNRFASMAAMVPVLPLIGGGKTKFQPVYVGDVAEGVAAAVDLPGAEGKTYELGGAGVYTFEDLLKLILRETNRSAALIPLPFKIARLIGSVAQITAVVGIAPPLTKDQVVSLESDNVVSQGAEGLAALGVQPTGVEAIVPGYLWRYRRGGEFAESPAH